MHDNEFSSFAEKLIYRQVTVMMLGVAGRASIFILYIILIVGSLFGAYSLTYDFKLTDMVPADS